MHKIKSNSFMLISPLLVIFIVSLIYAFYGIFPFGSKTVAWCDLKQQTIPLLMDLKDILDGKSNIFYSAASCGGMNFWGVFLFFLASPFYLSVKFVEKQDIVYLVNILLALKLALCAFTATLYFSVRFEKISNKYKILFGLIYAFCGYGLMYYQTLVWLDIMYLFPMLVLSVERLCRQKKFIFFIITLCSCVAVNYYLSFMIIVYLIISVPLYIALRCTEKDKKTVSFMFVMSSVTAALITAPVWLCSLIQVRESARSMNNLAKLIYESPFESLKDKLCLLCTDAFIFAALVFLIKSPLLKKKRVRYNLILLVFLIIPVFIDPINKMWHGGGYQGFPLRFGYMIIFTILSIVSEIIETLPENRKSSPIYSIAAFTVMLIMAAAAVYVVTDRKKTLSSYVTSLWITNGFFKTVFGLFIFAFTVYILFFFLLKKRCISSNIFFLLVSGVFITEVFVNMSVYVGYASSEDTLFDKTVALENKIQEEDYYRVKTEKKYTHVNMIGALGLNSYAHYTSLTPEDYMFVMKKMGYSSYWMEVGSNGGTAMTDALLGIKYSIGSEYDFRSYQKELETNTVLRIAENLICVPAGIISDADPELSENLDYTDRFEVQRQLAELYFGSDDLLEKYEHSAVWDGLYDYSDGKYNITVSEPDLSRCHIIYNIKVDGHQTLYFDLFDDLNNYVNDPLYDSVKVSVNGITLSESYPDKKNNGFLELGEFENENAEIIVTLLKDVSVKSFGVFGVDTDKLEKEVAALKTTEPVLNGNEISAECSADENEYLYLAVPWDSGFKAYLNGSKTTLYKVNDSFCAVKLNEGQNSVKLVFCPKGFKVSLILMLSGLVSAVFICRKKQFFNNRRAGTVSVMLCRFAAAAVILLVYIVPVIIYTAGFIIRLGVW